MGICELPSLRNKSSVAFEDHNTKNIIQYLKFPKGEHFYLKNHIKPPLSLTHHIYDKIHLSFTFMFSDTASSVTNKQFKLEIHSNTTIIAESQVTSPSESKLLIFTDPIALSFQFEQSNTPLLFKILETTNNNNLLCECECSLVSLLTSHSDITLNSTNNTGTLVIKFNSISKTRALALFDMDLNIVSKLNLNSKITNMSEYSSKLTNDRCYFYLLKNSLDGSTWKKLYKSNEFCRMEFMNSFELITDVLCLCDKSKQIKIEVFEVVKPPLAECVQENPNKDIEVTTLSEPLAYEVVLLSQIEEIMKTQGNYSFVLTQPKTNVDTYTSTNSNNKIITAYFPYQYSDLGGSVDNVYKMSLKYIEKDFTAFTELIRHDKIDIKLICGIDYRNIINANNAQQQKEDTQLLIDNTKYIIQTVSNVLIQYNKDSQRNIPSYGFGSNVNKDKCIAGSNVFPLGSTDGTDVTIDNIITLYESNLNKSTTALSSDNVNINICEVIETIVQSSKRETNVNGYSVILIILNKDIVVDVKQLKNIIVQLADHPLSLVMVGLGNERYEDVMILDNEDFPVYDTKGDKVKREMFQFKGSNNSKESLKEMCNEILQEIPRQIEEYFEMEKAIKFSLLSN